MVWEYLQPVTIRFGEGVVGELKQVAGELGCHRGLLVSDPFFMKSGLAEKIVESSEGALDWDIQRGIAESGSCGSGCLRAEDS